MIRLSKSRFVAGLQCHKMLWWKFKEPDAPELEVDPGTQAIFDAGTKIGEIATTYFGDGVLIDFPHYEIANKIRATKEAIESGAKAIFEASFMEDDVFVAVDILEKVRGDWILNEVKSTTRAKPQHVPDVAVQTHVLQKAGLNVKAVNLMHLNRECRYPDLSNLFAKTDLSDAAFALKTDTENEIRAQIHMLKGPVPDVEIGPHCTNPYDCPFYWRCWKEPPEHHIGTLYRIGQKAAELKTKGIQTIFDLPSNYPLSQIADRQRRAVQSGKTIIESGLDRAISKWDAPIAYLDFETINMVIPVWNGCHPYDQVPVQFSCHVLDGQGKVEHFEYLADGPDDPREALAKVMLGACKDAKTILAYNAGFERRCVRELAKALPHLADDLYELNDKIDDLLPVIRNHVYHPDFHGSFSIKSVLPALISLDYSELEIGDGQTASVQLEAILFAQDQMTAQKKTEIRENLLKYCKLDTWAMVKLLEWLKTSGAS